MIFEELDKLWGEEEKKVATASSNAIKVITLFGCKVERRTHDSVDGFGKEYHYYITRDSGKEILLRVFKDRIVVYSAFSAENIRAINKFLTDETDVGFYLKTPSKSKREKEEQAVVLPDWGLKILDAKYTLLTCRAPTKASTSGKPRKYSVIRFHVGDYLKLTKVTNRDFANCSVWALHSLNRSIYSVGNTFYISGLNNYLLGKWQDIPLNYSTSDFVWPTSQPLGGNNPSEKVIKLRPEVKKIIHDYYGR